MGQSRVRLLTIPDNLQAAMDPAVLQEASKTGADLDDDGH